MPWSLSGIVTHGTLGETQIMQWKRWGFCFLLCFPPGFLARGTTESQGRTLWSIHSVSKLPIKASLSLWPWKGKQMFLQLNKAPENTRERKWVKSLVWSMAILNGSSSLVSRTNSELLQPSCSLAPLHCLCYCCIFTRYTSLDTQLNHLG